MPTEIAEESKATKARGRILITGGGGNIGM
jgi:FlaA1/EpsC-like NDP-sugar epimerase